MSINVTVTGNPVNFNKKMVITDPNYYKKEFEKRRLIRLQQVRQQSKDIAENVRNKVRKEKCKQMSKIENEGKEKLKKWQTRKLLELHNQYQEGLNDIGLGQENGKIIDENERKLLEQKQLIESEIAKERGLNAIKKLKSDNKIKKIDKNLPHTQKAKSKNIEKTRSSLVSKIHRINSPISNKLKKRRKLTNNDINITSEEEEENSELEEESLIELSSSETAQFPSSTNRSNPSSSLSESKKVEEIEMKNTRKSNKDKQTNTLLEKSEVNNDKSVQTYLRELIPVSPQPQDTRISDHIKRRTITNTRGTDFCELFESNSSKFHDENNENLPENIKPCHCQSEIRNKNNNQIPKQVSKENPEIPKKPKVTLRSSTISENTNSKNQNEVHYYNHFNKYSKRYIPTKSDVQKIEEDNLIIGSDIASNCDKDFEETMIKRDYDAKIRGQRALEKEKFLREYNELLNKLPLLQKQERICDIKNDKIRYHMSDERLKEQERIKQNYLDNAYEKLCPEQNQRKRSTATVTLKSKFGDDLKKNKTKTDSFKSLDCRGSWDVQNKSPKLFTSEEVKKIIEQLNQANETITNKSVTNNRAVQLKELLDSLKAKKDLLLNEIINMPPIENSEKQSETNLLKIKRQSSKQSVKQTETIKRKKSSINDRNTSSSSSIEDLNSKEIYDKKRLSPRKKVKLKNKIDSTCDKRKVIILQNTSTQTTPKISKITDGKDGILTEEKCTCTSPNLLPTEKIEITKKVDKKCQCCKNVAELQNSKTDNEPIEIVIKTVSKEKPDVILTKSDKNVKIIQDKQQKEKELEKRNDEKSVKKSKVGKPKEKITSPQSLGKSTWHEHLSRNSYFSTSASFLNTTDPNNKSKSILDQKLNMLECIKKVLTKSRGSIDNLTVSGVSEVTTPSQSIIDMESNNPLMPVLKFLQENFGDFQVNGDELKIQDQKNLVEEKKDGNELHISVSKNQDNSEIKNVENKNYILEQYTDIVESCNRRILDLNLMIEKVREEKLKMLQSPPESILTEDISTAYMDLPPILKLNDGKQSSSTSASSISLEQEELNRLLLEIDESHTERLKKIKKNQEHLENSTTDKLQSSDEELIERYRKLLEIPQVRIEEKVQKLQEIPKENNFIPLLDVRKKPNLLVNKPEFDLNIISNNTKKRPPTSKGLTVARRFNDNISVNPHELSTIVEADSAKIDLNQSKGFWTEPSKQNIETKSALTTKSPLSPSKSRSNNNSANNGASSSNSTDNTIPDLLTALVDSVDKIKSPTIIELSSSSTSNSISDDKSGLEAMEQMLYSIGLEWAIPTLRKTRESLQLLTSSSNSSLDLSKKKQTNDQLCKVSSSTLKSDLSPGGAGLFTDQDISEICSNDSKTNKSRTNQRRTSTPVVDNIKSKRQMKRVCFSDESDSIKNKSDENEPKFYSLSEQGNSDNSGK